MDVAVLGAGLRGRTVTRQCARAEHGVCLYGEDATTVIDSVDAADDTLTEGASTGHVTGIDRAEASGLAPDGPTVSDGPGRR